MLFSCFFLFSICVANIEMACSFVVYSSTSMWIGKSKAREET